MPDAAAAPSAIEHHGTSGIASNHDIHIGADFLAANLLVAPVLDNPELSVSFKQFDQSAKKAKTRYHAIGIGSLVVTLVALEGEVATVAMEATGSHTPWAMHVVVRGFGVIAFILIVLNRLGGYRRSWCHAVFLRERMRQWQHELLLDGEFLDHLQSDSDAALVELSRRWVEFKYDFSGVDGAFQQFLTPRRADEDFCHARSRPRDPALLEEVIRVQRCLRMDYQARYAHMKLADDEGAVSIRDLERWSESVASATLFFAVIATGAAFVLTVAPVVSENTVTWLSAVAIGLGLLSGVVRVFRSGMTIPGEAVSYHAYAHRVVKLDTLFKAPATTDDERFDLLVELEEESIEELRRFLELKSKSTFVF